MIRYYAIFICMLLTQALAWELKSEELTPAQQRFRAEILQFVREEGFSPHIDESDQTVTFKKEGVLYWISVGDDGPFFLEFHRAGLNCEEVDRNIVLEAVNEANKKVLSAKAILYESTISFAVELFCHSAEEFKYIFYKCMKELDSAKEKVSDYYNEHAAANSSAPFTIRSVSVANTDHDGSILTPYDSKIYGNRSKYITPKIYVDVKTAGTYDIYIKFYTPAGLSTGSDGSSPTDYSYKASVTMAKGFNSYVFNGWGGKDAGHWKAGDYRFEFYYQGKQIGKKAFTLY